MLRILYLAANPSTTDPLRLGREIRTIAQRIRECPEHDRIQIVAHWAVRPDDMRRALLEVDPHVVHFSGHGLHRGELVLHDEHDQPTKVPPAAVAQLLGILSNHLRLVFLNACHGDDLAAQLVAHVDYALAMRQRIGDDAAISFASAFYEALAFGQTIQRAFDLGRNALQLGRLGNYDAPIIFARPGSTTDIALVPPRQGATCSTASGGGRERVDGAVVTTLTAMYEALRERTESFGSQQSGTTDAIGGCLTTIRLAGSQRKRKIALLYLPSGEQLEALDAASRLLRRFEPLTLLFASTARGPELSEPDGSAIIVPEKVLYSTEWCATSAERTRTRIETFWSRAHLRTACEHGAPIRARVGGALLSVNASPVAPPQAAGRRDSYLTTGAAAGVASAVLSAEGDIAFLPLVLLVPSSGAPQSTSPQPVADLADLALYLLNQPETPAAPRSHDDLERKATLSACLCRIWPDQHSATAVAEELLGEPFAAPFEHAETYFELLLMEIAQRRKLAALTCLRGKIAAEHARYVRASQSQLDAFEESLRKGHWPDAVPEILLSARQSDRGLELLMRLGTLGYESRIQLDTTADVAVEPDLTIHARLEQRKLSFELKAAVNSPLWGLRARIWQGLKATSRWLVPPMDEKLGSPERVTIWRGCLEVTS